MLAVVQGFPAVTPELDLVEQEDQITHELSLEDELDQKTGLGTFYTPLNSFVTLSVSVNWTILDRIWEGALGPSSYLLRLVFFLKQGLSSSKVMVSSR
jgi:hypothetical protein